jgi:CBS domain-containing protein
VIVRLDGHDHPPVTGLVADVGGHRLFLPAEEVVDWSATDLTLRGDRLDLRAFARREGEVLLREDILGHRLIDIPAAALVTAWDLELAVTSSAATLVGVDVRPRAWWRRALGRLLPGPVPVTDDERGCRDWVAFEALIGHAPSILARTPLDRLRDLKAPQLADLLEEASRSEQAELLDRVHADPELEADVFEELEEDDQSRLFRDRADDDVAGVLARMNADDATDALMDLPQERRRRVLDLLPPPRRAKVVALLGYNPTSAGGLMIPDHLAVSASTTVAEVLDRVRTSAVQPGVLATVLALDADDRLCGSVPLVLLVQAAPGACLADVAEADPVRVRADADVVEVALVMSDYDLLALPVVDGDGRVLGVVTVDDALEAAVPEDWRRRELPEPSV